MAESKSAALPLGYAPTADAPVRRRGGAEHKGWAGARNMAATSRSKRRLREALRQKRGAASINRSGIWRLLCGALSAYAAAASRCARRLHEKAAMSRGCWQDMRRARTRVHACKAAPAAALDCVAPLAGRDGGRRSARMRSSPAPRSRSCAGSQAWRAAWGSANTWACGIGMRCWGEERGRCNLDRTCLTASYRAQIRFLDRLQQCLDTSSAAAQLLPQHPQRRARGGSGGELGTAQEAQPALQPICATGAYR